jgi:hypothetical protein
VKSMVQYLLKFLLTASLLVWGGRSVAQQQPIQKPSSADGVSDPNHELSEMVRRYKLDSTQKRDIKPILESRAEDLENLRREDDLSPGQRAEKVQELRRVCNREIEAILHERQRVQFEQDQR